MAILINFKSAVSEILEQEFHIQALIDDSVPLTRFHFDQADCEDFVISLENQFQADLSEYDCLISPGTTIGEIRTYLEDAPDLG